MSDMRLIVAGAGGRMGRTLVQAIAASPGVALAGAWMRRAPPRSGATPASWRGSATTASRCMSQLEPLLRRRRRADRFHRPAGDRRLRGAPRARNGLVHVIGTTGLSVADEAVIDAEAGSAPWSSNPAI